MYHYNDGDKVKIGNGNMTTAREPDITNQVNIQDKLTQELLEYTAKLEERLARVLRADAPVASKDVHPEATLVPMANQLRDHNERIMAVTARLNGVLNRLEL